MPNRRKPKTKRTPIERLILARSLAEALERNPLVSARAGLSLKMHHDAGDTEVTLTEPDETLMKALVLDLGPFVRNDEDTYLPKVMTLAVRHIDDPMLAHAIESAQHFHRTEVDLIQLNIDGKRVTGETAANLWLNASYFHRDPEKAAALAGHGKFAAPLVRHQFLSYLFEMTKLAIWVGSVIARAEDLALIRANPIAPASSHPHTPGEFRASRAE